MAAAEILIQIATRFWEILAAPAKNLDMLWILIPIYLNWFVTDYYQEKKGTDFGNAITNGVVTLWAGIDWIRQLLKSVEMNAEFMSKIGISIFYAIYGLIIMVESARAKKIAHYIGRVREVSYFAIVLTPIFYGVIVLDWITLTAILIFFPVIYLITEVIDRILPAPPGEEEDFGKLPDMGKESQMPELGAGMEMPQQSFGQYLQQYPSQPMPKF